MKRRMPGTALMSTALSALLFVTGCQTAPDRPPIPAQEAPDLKALRVPEALVIGESRVRIPVQDVPFVISAAEPSDPLPAATIPEAALYDVGLLEALETMFAAARVPVTVIASPNVDQRRITLLQRRPVPLSVLLEQLALDQGFFYTYKDGVLRVSRERSFAVTLPPIGAGAVSPASIQSTGGSTGTSGSQSNTTGATGGSGTPTAAGGGGASKRIDDGLDIYAPIQTAIERLGGSNVLASRLNRVIVFTATRDKLPMIERYLNELRSRGKLILVDTWVVEVQLSDTADIGIDWSKAQINFGGGRQLSFAASNKALEGFTLGFSGSFGRTALDILANFLAGQGTAQTVAAPRLMMVSGSRADFTSGENIPYVQAVNLSQGSTGTLLAGGSVVYANVGLAMSVVADAMQDSVFLSLGLRTSSLVEFRRFEIGSVVSDAPRLTERTYTAEVRLPIGEAVVINGIRQGGDSVTKRQIPGVGEVLPLVAGRNTETRSRSELVVVLRPRVVEFEVDRSIAPPSSREPGRAPALPAPEDGDRIERDRVIRNRQSIDQELERDGFAPTRLAPSTGATG